MEIQNLNGRWRMRQQGETEWLDAQIPGSVYSNLLELQKIPDPYYRENQDEVCVLSQNDYVFEREFDVSAGMFRHDLLFLRFDGLDTLADIWLNGECIGHADNMHRVWEYEVKQRLKEGKNTLSVQFASPIRYITQKQEEYPLWGVGTTIPGYPHIRKAHYMFGWDWGPKLPDMGIWRPVYLIGADAARLDGVYVSQKQEDGQVTLSVRVDVERFDSRPLTAAVTLTAPDGSKQCGILALQGDSGTLELRVENPEIWWPHGYGAQPLYTLETILQDESGELDRKSMRIGLRTVTISQENDQWGQEFCFLVNGVKIFAMGADYIPEEQIIARCSRSKTQALLEQCIKANFNCIRVWGGGYYPEDWFFDLCDEMGLLVWEDFMFACAVYRMTDAFRENIRQELIDNIKRIRHHACLGLWCGNNENEAMWCEWGIPQIEELKQDYLEQFEELIPSICREYDPNTFYWPSSPSSGGEFADPIDVDRGDMHYWDVWHGMKPLTEFRKFYFRFCSEYGFESLPNVKTIRAFAEEEDLNLFSAVMEAHQKCEDGNKKLLYYLSQMVRYPYSFEGVVYATQLLQADAIRSNVEHMRRNRGRCMGSAYWQVNDSNPIISWSSIDSENRWKALHYYARRFYAPVLLSANEEDVSALLLNVSNERVTPLKGTIRWSLRDNRARVLKEGSVEVEVSPLSAKDCCVLDLSDLLSSPAELRSRYLEYSLTEGDEVLSYGNSLFVRPKHFLFERPNVKLAVTEEDSRFVLLLTADAYAKSVCLDLKEADCTFSDNWFDIHGQEPVRITVDKDTVSPPLDLEHFVKELTVFSNYDIGNENQMDQ